MLFSLYSFLCKNRKNKDRRIFFLLISFCLQASLDWFPPSNKKTIEDRSIVFSLSLFGCVFPNLRFSLVGEKVKSMYSES